MRAEKWTFLEVVNLRISDPTGYLTYEFVLQVWALALSP